MNAHCKGCNESLVNLSPALSRYGHGDICPDCGTLEAFHGDFIKKYFDNDEVNTPADIVRYLNK